MDLAIIIVNYNTRDDLHRCLSSIRQSRGPLHYEVVVVDNSSSDGSAEMVREKHPWVQHLVVNDYNGGYAYANNIGLRLLGYAQGRPLEELPRYALLLNPDTVLPPEALAEMVAFMDAHPDVGVVGPKLVREDGSLDKACRRSFPTPAVSFYRLSGLAKLFPKSRRFGRYNLTYLDENEQADVDAVVGAFMLMRSEALEQAGLLDEAFFMYGEDLDLCYRIKEHGWRVVYNPAVTVLHRKGAASRKASRRAIRAFYDAMKIFHDKHYRAQTFFLINWAIDLGIVLLRSIALLLDRLRPPRRKRVASA
ncbi:MAG: glycosyltransferase family 2 protein [Anaerolineae bacterium]|nr:glycosyltransferase family 2 protein [Anaerolineae bacterium]